MSDKNDSNTHTILIHSPGGLANLFHMDRQKEKAMKQIKAQMACNCLLVYPNKVNSFALKDIITK